MFCESFDHYTGSATMNLKWNSGNPTGLPATSFGRNGRGVRLVGSGELLIKDVGTHITLVAGAAFQRNTSTNTTTILRFRDSGSATQINILLNSDGSISIQRGSTTVATSVNGGSTPAISIGTYNYVEGKATIDNTSGYVEVRINGVVYVTFSGDTQATANTDVKEIVFTNSANAGDLYYDDIYICNTSGTTNNNFLGDIRVECVFASATGTYAQWTTTGSSINFQNIDENSPNTTDYNYSSTPGQADTFNFNDLAITSGQLFGIQRFLFARKDDAGSRFIAPIYRRNSIDVTGTVLSLGDTFTYYRDILELDPSITGTWTISNFNASEWGYEMIS